MDNMITFDHFNGRFHADGNFMSKSSLPSAIPLTTSGEAIFKSYAKPINEHIRIQLTGGLNNSHCGRSLIR
ncbi:hypothetical protein DERP_007428 [Dermatophagoides pteronyssinus]|uniref:Uncharacterized protein n=1 Tax=Dermatophagoides pteronyssinus TaxID=6956 RepID=A0ABQ8J4K6_DERPT|nr:hypothetical protein DERP_007428 [Dermatophagoides pteronyssinus]